MTLAQDNKCYSAKIRWLHPGVHSVNIMLDGVVVPGTPIRTNAEGKRLALISSALIGDGATTCVAGEDAATSSSWREITVETPSARAARM